MSVSHLRSVLTSQDSLSTNNNLPLRQSAETQSFALFDLGPYSIGVHDFFQKSLWKQDQAYWNDLPDIFNPTQSTLPDFTNLTAEQFEKFCHLAFEFVQKKTDAFLANLGQSFFIPRWENTLAEANSILLVLRRVENYLQLTENVDVLRDLTPDVLVNIRKQKNNLQNRLLQDANYYRSLQKIENHTCFLDEEQKRIVAYRLQQAKWAGAELNSDQKTKVNDIQNKLSDLYSDFKKNADLAANSEALRIDDIKKLNGISPKQITDWQKVENGTKYWQIDLTLKNYRLITSSCQNQETIMEFYKAFTTQASDNEKVLDQILILRQELAQIYGYENFAKMKLEQKGTFDSSSEAENFVKNWLDALKSDLNYQKTRYTKIIGEEEGGEERPIQPWDLPYYAPKLDADIKFNPNDYDYPLDLVKPQAFRCFEELLQVDIVKAQSQKTWNPDVEYYEVRDKNTHEVLGCFFWDIYTRDNKAKGNFSLELIAGERDVDGKMLVCPQALFSTNISQTTNILTARDVTTVFHELGHIMNYILGNRPYQVFSGVAVLQETTDLTEVLGGAIEYYLYNPEIQVAMARAKTDKAPPNLEDVKKYYEQAPASKSHDLSLTAIRVLVDLQAHAGAENPHELYAKNLKQWMPLYQLDFTQKPFNYMPFWRDESYAGVYYQYALKGLLAPLVFQNITDNPGSLRSIYELGSSATTKELLEILIDTSNIVEVDFSEVLKAEGLQVAD